MQCLIRRTWPRPGLIRNSAVPDQADLVLLGGDLSHENTVVPDREQCGA
jgi:hypothetical protein